MFHFHDEFDSLPFFFSTDTELHGFVDLSFELKEQQRHNEECVCSLTMFSEMKYQTLQISIAYIPKSIKWLLLGMSSSQGILEFVVPAPAK